MAKQQPSGADDGAVRSQYVSQIAVLVCPSNPTPDLGDNPLSYVVNTGIAVSANDNWPGSAPTWPEDGNAGVFMNHSQIDFSGQPTRKTTLDFVGSNDGTSHTLMMSENLQATNWAIDPNAVVATFPLGFGSDFAVRQNTGYVWFLTGNENNSTTPPPAAPLASSYNVDVISINANGKSVSGIPQTGKWASATPFEWKGLAYARPSSSHPGGVNAVFCDGHLTFLNEDISYAVYTQLMTPLQKQVIVDYTTAGTSTVPPSGPIRVNMTSGTATANNKVYGNTTIGGWTYILNEADYN